MRLDPFQDAPCRQGLGVDARHAALDLVDRDTFQPVLFPFCRNLGRQLGLGEPSAVGANRIPARPLGFRPDGACDWRSHILMPRIRTLPIGDRQAGGHVHICHRAVFVALLRQIMVRRTVLRGSGGNLRYRIDTAFDACRTLKPAHLRTNVELLAHTSHGCLSRCHGLHVVSLKPVGSTRLIRFRPSAATTRMTAWALSALGTGSEDASGRTL